RLDLNSSGSQLRCAFAGNRRIRIVDRIDNACDTSRNQRIRARWRSPVMTAGFEIHVGRSAFGRLARERNQRSGLTIRTASTLLPALRDDLLATREHAPNPRVRMRRLSAALRKLQRARHRASVELTEWRRGHHFALP